MAITSSELEEREIESQFRDYEKYLARLAELRASGRLCSTQRPLSMERFTALRRTTTDAERLQALLYPGVEAGRRVYLANALGFSTSGRGYREELHAALEALGCEVLDPWDDNDTTPESVQDALRIGRGNFHTIETCGRVLAVLDGIDVDSGVACECGYACALGIRVDGIRIDTRRSGDSPAIPINLQVATAILVSGGRLLFTIEDLAELDRRSGQGDRDRPASEYTEPLPADRLNAQTTRRRQGGARA